ncbi:MAG: DALR domain-containing protein, partial [Nitrososphaerota archaeon]
SHTGKTLAKIWMHVGMVTMKGEKMSKSLGNIKSVDYVIKNWGPNIIRLFCLSGHYSKPIDYSEDLLKENIIKWRQVENCYFELILAEGDSPTETTQKLVSKTKKEFEDALKSNFNTPLALAVFFKFVKELNRLAATEALTQSIAKIALPEFKRMLETLGLTIPKITSEEKSVVNDLIKKRNMLRDQKQFEEADKIRKQIADMGIMLIDHKNKTLWLKREKIAAEN